MVNWKENNYLFKRFTEELTQEWIDCGFNKTETKKWLEGNLKSTDAKFAQWLRDVKKNDAEWFAEEGDEEELRKEFQSHLTKQKHYSISKRVTNGEKDWKYIHDDLTEELQKEWESKRFSYAECKEWIDIGLTVNDAEYAYWLKEIKQKDSEWVLNHGNNEELREEYANSKKEYEVYLEEVKNGSKFSDPKNYLDYHYPPAQRLSIRRLGLNDLCLRGELDLKDFPNLRELNIANNPQLQVVKNISGNAKVTYTNIQQWLNTNYPHKEEVKEIDLALVPRNLVNLIVIKAAPREWISFLKDGELIIANFPKLERIIRPSFIPIKKVTKVTIANCPRLQKLDIPDFNDNQELNLINVPSLKELHCNNNQLTKVDLSNCPNLMELNFSNNSLTSLDFLKKLPHSEKLTSLDISNNNFSLDDLSTFDRSKFTNLKNLWIDNDEQEKVDQKDYYSLENIISHSLTRGNYFSSFSPPTYSPPPSFTQNTSLNEFFDNSNSTTYVPFPYQNPSLFSEIPDPGLPVNEKQTDKSWDAIHPDFAEMSYSWPDKNYQQEWEINGFAYEEAKKWVENGFEPKKAYSAKKWKEIFTCEETRQWIEVGFNFNDWEIVKQWKNFGFTPQETKPWIKTGLKVSDEYELAYYLKKEGHHTVNKELKKKYYDWVQNLTAQQWLDYFFPLVKRKKITELNIYQINQRILKGSLNLNDFVNLCRLNCFNNKLTSLDISRCEKLMECKCSRNELITLFLPKKGEKLTKLEVDNNQLTDLSIFSHLTNLEELTIQNNYFTGSLEPLRKLKKLKHLGADDGWEYLNGKGNVTFFEKDPNKDNLVFQHKLPLWRQEQIGFKELQNFLFQINPSLDIHEVIEQFHFFNVKNGFFQGNLEDLKLIFKANIERTTFLEETIKDLKAKILVAYCRLAPESDLLQLLINAELVYRKAKEQNFPSYKLSKERDNIKSRIEKKISEEQMEEVELILTDCEKLVINDLELESIVARTNKVIEEAKIRMININIDEVVAHRGNIIIGNIIKEAAEKVEALSVSNKLNSVSSMKGNVIVGNQIGEKANFGYEEELETKIQIPPKN